MSGRPGVATGGDNHNSAHNGYDNWNGPLRRSTDCTRPWVNVVGGGDAQYDVIRPV